MNMEAKAGKFFYQSSGCSEADHSYCHIHRGTGAYLDGYHQCISSGDADDCMHQYYIGRQPEPYHGVYGPVFAGPCGFMSIGAYTCALITMRIPTIWGFCRNFGGNYSGIAGLVVGLPTLRLRGDYRPSRRWVSLRLSGYICQPGDHKRRSGIKRHTSIRQLALDVLLHWPGQCC